MSGLELSAQQLVMLSTVTSHETLYQLLCTAKRNSSDQGQPYLVCQYTVWIFHDVYLKKAKGDSRK